MPFTLHGLAVSQGIAIGHVHLVSHALLEVNHYHVAPRYLEEESARLDEAVASVQGELLGLKAITTSGRSRRTCRSRSKVVSRLMDLGSRLVTTGL